MSELTEKRGAGLHIVSEANGNLSREQGVLDTGNLETGTILGKITSSGKYVQVNLAAVDGSETAVAVLWDKADASSADQKITVHTRLCELLTTELVYPTGASDNDKAAINADLADRYMIVR